MLRIIALALLATVALCQDTSTVSASAEPSASASASAPAASSSYFVSSTDVLPSSSEGPHESSSAEVHSSSEAPHESSSAEVHSSSEAPHESSSADVHSSSEAPHVSSSADVHSSSEAPHVSSSADVHSSSEGPHVSSSSKEKSSTKAPASSSMSPTPKPPAPPAPPVGITDLSYSPTGNVNDTCIKLDFTQIQLKSGSLTLPTLNNNTAAISVVHALSSCGIPFNGSVIAQLAIHFALRGSNETVDLTFHFKGAELPPPPPSSSAVPKPSTSKAPNATSTAKAPNATSTPAPVASSSAHEESSTAPVASSSAHEESSAAHELSSSATASAFLRRAVRRAVVSDDDIASWFVSRIQVIYTINANTSSEFTIAYDNATASPFAASNGKVLSCSDVGAQSNNTDVTIDGFKVQPFNVKDDAFSPGTADSCAAADTSKDHTLAIAIAASVGGLVVIAGLIYLCRRGGRSQYEELRA